MSNGEDSLTRVLCTASSQLIKSKDKDKDKAGKGAGLMGFRNVV